MYVRTVSPHEAEGAVKAMYDAAQASEGYLPNQVQLFSLNPEARAAWRHLVESITDNLDHRRYELVTMAAAATVQCRYCVSAHATVLMDSDYFDREQVEAITRDFRSADSLDARDKEVMVFAEKVALDANRITPEDVDHLRQHGLGEREIFDITLAAAARVFYSKVLQAMDAEPDEALAATNGLVDLVELKPS
ncbi:MAG TPA: carboxymuconolactone decarboxylase family protein [Candidatus Limnocylindria bacterium]|nr:carboxymuconolactone decarboxylase family protein [Candidatus Limnocylindria bacterium]